MLLSSPLPPCSPSLADAELSEGHDRAFRCPEIQRINGEGKSIVLDVDRHVEGQLYLPLLVARGELMPDC